MNPFLNQQAPEFVNPLDAIKFIVEELSLVSKEISRIRNELTFKTYTVMDLARMLECSEGTLRNNPWKLPLYGNPEIGTKPGAWFHDTCSKWYHIPEATRKAYWESLGSEARREAQGSVFEELKKVSGF